MIVSCKLGDAQRSVSIGTDLRAVNYLALVTMHGGSKLRSRVSHWGALVLLEPSRFQMLAAAG